VLNPSTLDFRPLLRLILGIASILERIGLRLHYSEKYHTVIERVLILYRNIGSDHLFHRNSKLIPDPGPAHVITCTPITLMACHVFLIGLIRGSRRRRSNWTETAAEMVWKPFSEPWLNEWASPSASGPALSSQWPLHISREPLVSLHVVETCLVVESYCDMLGSGVNDLVGVEYAVREFAIVWILLTGHHILWMCHTCSVVGSLTHFDCYANPIQCYGHRYIMNANPALLLPERGLWIYTLQFRPQVSSVIGISFLVQGQP